MDRRRGAPGYARHVHIHATLERGGPIRPPRTAGLRPALHMTGGAEPGEPTRKAS